MSGKHVCVVGLGYVGLPTAAVLASRGNQVTGVDTNPTTVETINNGKPHIVEPDLDMVVYGAVSVGKLKASTTPVPADAFIMAVPTPFNAERKPDLKHLQAATHAIADILKVGDLVIVESTVPVGATAQVGAWLAEARPDLKIPSGDDPTAEHDICISHSPERVLPGQVLLELVRNDRVIGGLGHDCAQKTADLYRAFVEGEMHLTDAKTAELVKLSENAYRDVNIAFANELANVAEPLGIDVREVIELANRHPRVNVLNPGPGVGGHCIAVDPWFIVATDPKNTPLIRTAREVNDGRPATVAEQIANTDGAKSGGVIACLGLSYKADIDDLRESPSIEVIKQLRQLVQNQILVIEPNVDELPVSLKNLKDISLVSLDQGIKDSVVLVLLTDHKIFKSIPTDILEEKDTLDTRGVWTLT
jgi:UDP-N-acetyl-D-mannosaminuronic acid dehydrogenase